MLMGFFVHAVLWNLWKERNLRIFEDKHKPSNELIDLIVREVGSWLFVTKEFQGMSLADFVHDWNTCISLASFRKTSPVSCWMPPPPGVLKLNFDSSSLGNPGLSGFGCVIQDSHG